MANHKKIKNWLIPAAVGGVVLVLTVASIVTGAVQRQKEKESNAASVSVDKINLRDDNTPTQVSNVKTEVEIQFEDCAVPVGTQLKMTALVVPENTEQALIWSTADSSILEVDKEGILTVKGVGTTVVTATVGTVSDSVVIEGIENVAAGSKNAFPVYTGSTLAQGSTTGTTGTGTASGGDGSGSDSGKVQGGSQGDSQSTGVSVSGGNSGGDSSSDGSSTQNGGDGTASSDNGSTGNSSSGNSSSGGTSGNSGNTSGGSGTSGNGGSSSTEVSDDLTNIGFTQRLSNVYVCEDGNTYYGEIITQPNVTIIYIKQRSAAFDAKIQSVIEKLLPEEYGQVWSNYLSASTDRTFTVEGRRVRIVAAPNGGHSQIVIYN